MTKTLDYSTLDHLATPVFVLEMNEQGVPVYVAFNAYARMISGRPLSDYLNKSALEVYPQAYGRTAFERHCEVAASGEPITYHLDLPLGSGPRCIRTTLHPEKGPDGRTQRLFGSSTDITELREANEAKVNFDTLTSEMEQYVAMAAHDLRAPMRNVALLAGMLKEDFGDEDQGKIDLVHMMEDVSRKSMTLISDVLAQARATAPEAEATQFNFPSLCRDICDVLDPSGQHIFTSTPANILADRTAMQIAIRNILENALKHGMKDQLEIDIWIQPGVPDMLDVMIIDNGRGFSQAALKFLNGGPFRTDSGYGLFGVRRLIQARGGTIVARNAARDAGAVIRFSLPGQWVGATTSIGDPVRDWTVAPNAPPPQSRFTA